jgi:hypothetical protein
MVGDVLKRIGVTLAQFAGWAVAVTVFMVLPFVWPPFVLVWLAPFAWWLWENGIRR